MTISGSSGGKTFRPSASRLFLFLVGLELPLFICIILLRQGTRFQWSEMFLGLGMIVPFSILSAGAFSYLFPVRLTPQGIHAHSVWGLPCFISWQDIASVRNFSLPILPWLRLYPADGSTVIWLIMFPSTPDQFKLELQKLAPPGNPILSHIN